MIREREIIVRGQFYEKMRGDQGDRLDFKSRLGAFVICLVSAKIARSDVCDRMECSSVFVQT